jgi:hypothetical protein
VRSIGPISEEAVAELELEKTARSGGRVDGPLGRQRTNGRGKSGWVRCTCCQGGHGFSKGGGSGISWRASKQARSIGEETEFPKRGEEQNAEISEERLVVDASAETETALEGRREKRVEKSYVR